MSDDKKWTPYISFVIAFRNDNYTENAIAKFNFALNVLLEQLDKAKIESEIIIVDWNSPDPKKPLLDEINISYKSDYISVCLYEVDYAIHKRFKGHEKKGLIGEIAANVGIRRSRGKFVINKTSDTFYSQELINFLSLRELKENRAYRVDRIDTDGSFPIPSKWQEYFDRNIIIRKSSPKNTIHTKACGDFLLLNRKIWFLIKGFPESSTVLNLGADGEALHASIGSGASQEYLKGPICLYKLSHHKMYSSRTGSADTKNDNKLKQLLLGNEKKNLFQNYLTIVTRIIMGILNLPITKVSNVKTRSIYRYYLVANIRRLFFGANFIKNNDWGLSDLSLEKKVIVKSQRET